MTTEIKFNISANDTATAALSRINSSLEKVQAPLKKTQASADGLKNSLTNPAAEKGLSKIGDAAREVGEKIRSISAPLLALVSVGSVAAIGAMATSWGKVGFEVANAANAIGVSTTQLQALRGAASLAGVGASELDAGLKSIADTFQGAGFGRASPEALDMMKRLNIEVHKTKDGSVDAVKGLLDISRAIQGQDAARQRLITSTLGVGSLLPMLQKGPAVIEAFGEKYNQLSHVLSGPALEAAAQFEEKMILLHAAVDGLKNRIGDKLIPILSPLVDKFTDWIATISDDSIKKFTDQIEALVGWIKELYAKFKKGDFDQTISDVKAIGTAFADVCGDIAKALLMWDKWRNRNGTKPEVTHFLGLRFGRKEDLDAEDRANGTKPAASSVPTISAPPKVPAFPVALAVPPVSSVPAAPSVASVPGAASASATSATKKLMAMGWTKEQAAGMVGSLQQESGLDPNARNAMSGAYGIGQWLGGRVKDFKEFTGKDLIGSSLDDQLAFMNYELRSGKEKSAGRKLMAARTAEEAAAIHSLDYERPGKAEANISRRQANAEAILAKLDLSGPTVNVEMGAPNPSNGSPSSATASGALTALVRSQLSGGGKANMRTFQETAAARSDELHLTLTLVNAPAGMNARAERKDGENVPVRLLHAMQTA